MVIITYIRLNMIIASLHGPLYRGWAPCGQPWFQLVYRMRSSLNVSAWIMCNPTVCIQKEILRIWVIAGTKTAELMFYCTVFCIKNLWRPIRSHCIYSTNHIHSAKYCVAHWLGGNRLMTCAVYEYLWVIQSIEIKEDLSVPLYL